MNTATQAQEFFFTDPDQAIFFANAMLVLLYVTAYSLIGAMTGGAAKSMMTRQLKPGSRYKLIDKNLTPRQREAAAIRAVLLGVFWPLTITAVVTWSLYEWVKVAFTSLKPVEKN